MVHAWVIDESTRTDNSPELFKVPKDLLSVPELYKSTGVEHFKVSPVNLEANPILVGLRKDRGYSMEDEVFCSTDDNHDYEQKLELDELFTEHLHSGEGIRFVVEGGGYFDVRNADGKWIRIEMLPSDLIVLPAGLYHRFTLGGHSFVRTKRYFCAEPELKQYNIPADDLECRHEYLERLQNGFQEIAAK